MKEAKNELNRREFLKITGLTFATKSLWQLETIPLPQEKTLNHVRKKIDNPYTKNGRPIMVIIEGNDIDLMLKKGFEILGGIKKLCGTNKEIILKPNYVSPERYPEVTASDAICSMIDIIKKSGNYSIGVADASASGRSTIDGFKKTGLKNELDNRNVASYNLHDCPTVKIKVSEWQYMEEVEVFDKIIETPIIINMPTLKQHTESGFTCSLKNLMGCQSQSNRRQVHRYNERDKYSSAESILRMRLAIAETAHAINPELTILDARKIMLNAHQFSSGGILKDVNKLIISGDAVAVDSYAKELMSQFNPNFSKNWADTTLELAQKLELGTADLNKVETINIQV
jgi:uncharacterized protein (DUF362 family)